MKKKKEKKREAPPEFSFKEFTPEEDRIYEEAVSKYREAIASGRTLQEAYASYATADKELESMIQADFLKILIAERHFGKGETLEQLAGALSVSVDLLQSTKVRMLHETSVTAAGQFAAEFGGIAPETND